MRQAGIGNQNQNIQNSRVSQPANNFKIRVKKVNVAETEENVDEVAEEEPDPQEAEVFAAEAAEEEEESAPEE